MRVTLVSGTENPLRAIAIEIATMKEKDPISFVDEMNRIELTKYVSELFKTDLDGALEAAHITFLIEGVTRAFTHQIVRHRVGFSFSQQSLRFFDASQSGFRMPNVEPWMKDIIGEHVQRTYQVYANLIERGCPIEDARSILPTNVLTSISVSGTYRAWRTMASKRLCLQTQSEFREVMLAIKYEMAKVDPFLAEHLKPMCVNTGKCGFKSLFDRYCPNQENLKGGESSGEGS